MHELHVSRRILLERLLVLPAAAVVLAACGKDSSPTAAQAAASPSPEPTASSEPALAPTASPTAEAAATPAPTSAAPVSGWASGGTELITVGYPADDIFTAANTCAVSLTQGTTEGPCYFQSDTGEDISLGLTGLPMQLCLQVIDTSCAPLADHEPDLVLDARELEQRSADGVRRRLAEADGRVGGARERGREDRGEHQHQPEQRPEPS